MHHITKEDIKFGLNTLDMKEGSLLGVHSSISSFGYFAGGANAVLEALFETEMDIGTIVMSTYLLCLPFALTKEDISRGLTWKVKRHSFDDLCSPSVMGVIADTFRNRNDVTRWYHPFHSVSAWGKNADLSCQSFKPLVEANGKIFLLGVQMDHCSALNIAEERVQLPQEVKNLMEWHVPKDLLTVYSSDEWLKGCIGAWGDFFEYPGRI